MELVHRALKSTFVFALKGNRLAVRREQHRRPSAWTRIDALGLEEDTACAVWLGGIDFSVAVLRRRHKNVAGSEVDVPCVTNELDLSGADLLALHQKRWSIECYHATSRKTSVVGTGGGWQVAEARDCFDVYKTIDFLFDKHKLHDGNNL